MRRPRNILSSSRWKTFEENSTGRQNVYKEYEVGAFCDTEQRNKQTDLSSATPWVSVRTPKLPEAWLSLLSRGGAELNPKPATQKSGQRVLGAVEPVTFLQPGAHCHWDPGRPSAPPGPAQNARGPESRAGSLSLACLV